jgi:nucleoprotein TPR
MTKTRRQSKAAAAAASETPTREASPVPPQPPTQWTVNIPEDIDFDLLADLLPEEQLESPTPDTILSLYRLVVAQASAVDANQKEMEEARAEAQRKEVELDQALQDREAASKEVESVSETFQHQLQQLEKEKQEIGMLLLSELVFVL